MHGCDRWTVTFADGTQATSDTTDWSQIAAPRILGSAQFYVTTKPVVTLVTGVGHHTFRHLEARDFPHPFDAPIHAFRLYTSRVATDGSEDQLIRYDFGFVLLDQHLRWHITVDLEHDATIHERTVWYEDLSPREYPYY